MKKYDLIVVGAGSGGCAISKVAAEKGLSVLLLDMRKKEEIGLKLMYDTIRPAAFTTLNIPFPEGKEFDMSMTTLRVFSPNRKYFFDAHVEGTLSYRHYLGQRLLDYALKAGTELVSEAEVKEAIIKDGYVVGVKYSHEGKDIEAYAKVVCDASGVRAVVRDKLPEEIYQKEKLIMEDTVMAYREIHDLLKPCFYSPDHDFKGWYCTLRNRGYFWVVPQAKTQADIGCGIPMFKENPTPEKITEDYVAEPANAELYGKKIYAKGTGPTPKIAMRADQPLLVANGFVVVGEAAWQVSTNSGFGVHGSIIAAKLAAETIAEAIDKGDVSKEGLWKYNVDWKRTEGATRAFADGIRILIQNTTEDDLNTLIRCKVLGGKEFGDLWSDKSFRYNFGDMINKFFHGIGHISLLLRLFKSYKQAVKIEKLYKAFPEEASGFDEWNNKRKATYQKLFDILKLDRKLSA